MCEFSALNVEKSLRRVLSEAVFVARHTVNEQTEICIQVQFDQCAISVAHWLVGSGISDSAHVIHSEY
jgi:hypothetical protein